MLLLGGLLLAAGGIAARYAINPPEPAPAAAVEPGVDLPDGAQGFMRQSDESGRSLSDGASLEPTSSPPPAGIKGWLYANGPLFTNIGMSFVVGIVGGVFLRTFVKAIAGLAALAIVGLVAAAYFDVLPEDWTNLQTAYEQHAEGITQQARTVAERLTAVLPTTLSAAAGLLFGFLRGK
ncbi:MAG: FUN14 domain-containing protein [Phycisphaerae bacterium]